MMRLTETDPGKGPITLMVAGRITSESSPLLASECEALLRRGRQVRLDCHLVTYVDARGAAALRRLTALQIEIARCPPLIREFLDAGTT
ncbi:MAG: STAS domain-containing protein [Gemmatimonadetes bacterium]|nr:STAS domain-containing protein [Gemmatimonadota bacterium]